MADHGRTASKGSADPAVAVARAVVGLYGDPSVTWSVVLEYRLARPVDAGRLAAAGAELVEAHPHLGRPPALVRFSQDRYVQVLHSFADSPYGDRDPLVRIALSDGGDQVLLAAHHGVMDGLGMVAAMNALLGTTVTSNVRGIAGRAAGRGFLRAAAGRLWGAAVHPPARFRRSGEPDQGRPGDWLVAGTVNASRPTTSGLVLATRQAWEEWNGAPSRRPVVVAVGASRRSGEAVPAPDRDTAYLRLDATSLRTSAEAAAALAGTAPEPDFPATRGGGLGPLLTRRLRSRLGATALVSNLGVLSADGSLTRAAFWPVAGGPAGVAVGLVSVGRTTTLTLRARRGDFDRAAAERLHELVAARLAAQ